MILVLVFSMCFDRDMYLVLFAESTSSLESFFLEELGKKVDINYSCMMFKC